MVFGSVALAFRGTTFKVHWLDDPARIVCTQVFLAPPQLVSTSQRVVNSRVSHLSTGDSTELSTSIDATSVNSLSFSLCIRDDYTACLNHQDDMQLHSAGDSGYSGTDPWATSNSSRISNRSSVTSMFSETERKLSMDMPTDITNFDEIKPRSSFGSMQRRVNRHLSTSLENRLASADYIGQIGEQGSYFSSASELSGPKMRRYSEIVEKNLPDVRKRKVVSGDALPVRKCNSRRPRLGIAVFLKLNKGYENDLKLFCSEHMVMLEGMVNRVRASVDSAYTSRQNFIHIMVAAWHSAAQWLVDLFTAPRIARPVWLSLSTDYTKNSSHLAVVFMKDLNVLMSQTDTKDTNL